MFEATASLEMLLTYSEIRYRGSPQYLPSAWPNILREDVHEPFYLLLLELQRRVFTQDSFDCSADTPRAS